MIRPAVMVSLLFITLLAVTQIANAYPSLKTKVAITRQNDVYIHGTSLWLGSAAQEITTKDQKEDDEEVKLLQEALSDIIDEAPTGFKKICFSMGINIEGTLLYDCTVEVPEATKTSVWIPPVEESAPYVSSDFYKGNDKVAATKQYDSLVAKVKKSLPGWSSKERITDRKSFKTVRSMLQTTDKSGNGTTVEISLELFKSRGKYDLTLRVLAPEKEAP